MSSSLPDSRPDIQQSQDMPGLQPSSNDEKGARKAESERKDRGIESGDEVDYNDTFVLLVGEEEKPVVVHTAYICEKSTFFKLACSKPWKEATERTVRLPTATPAVFSACLDWIYRGEIKPCSIVLARSTVLARPSGVPNDAWIIATIPDQSHLEFYILADFLQDAPLCTQKIESLANSLLTLEKLSDYYLPGMAFMEHAYANTCASSPPRDFLVAVYVAIGFPQQFTEFLSRALSESYLEWPKG